MYVAVGLVSIICKEGIWSLTCLKSFSRLQKLDLATEIFRPNCRIVNLSLESFPQNRSKNFWIGLRDRYSHLYMKLLFALMAVGALLQSSKLGNWEGVGDCGCCFGVQKSGFRRGGRPCFRNRPACRTSAVGQELFRPGQFDSTGALLRDTNIYTVEVHNHGAAWFSVEVNVNPGW